MAQRTAYVPEIGEIILSKRKGARNMRLSINAAGKVRVGIPYWVPYEAGIVFAKSKAVWIKKHLASNRASELKEGDLIGKSHRIHFKQNNAKTVSTSVTKSQIVISTGLSTVNANVQQKAQKASERALKFEAEQLLAQRLGYLADKYGFQYKDHKIRKLTARWGSCSNHGTITLSFYLMQLPWHLIDYVLLHELVHTKHLHHGKAFWDEFKRVLPEAKAFQKEIRPYKPLIQAYRAVSSK